MNLEPRPSPMTAGQLVDEYFIENRTRLLEMAAFLDRLDRTDPAWAATDFRMKAFREALDALGGTGDRLTRIQLLLSDPSTTPLDRLDRKSALGAYDRGNTEERS
ncbi:MAG: hypothetical protein ABI818_14520 [Acidobacteriota bacterium]